MLATLREGRQPDWAAQDAKHWAVLVDGLVQRGEFAAAIRAVGELRRIHPNASVFVNLSLLLQAAPPASGDSDYDAFRDDPQADVQIVRRLGAKEVLLVFTGVSGRIGMALALAHRWFGMLGVHVVYLRDIARQAYNSGVCSLGASYEASLDGLWRLTDGLNAHAILTCGNSVGGLGALRHGLDLRARSIIAFSAASSLAPPITPAAELRRRGLRLAIDLKPFFLAVEPPPRTLLVYGAECEVDARQAGHLAGAPGVSLHALPGCERHDSVLRAVELGIFGDLLQRFVSP